MKRYEFRMEKVLRVRRLQEDAARAAVAASRRAEQQAQVALEASQAHYSSLAVDTPAASAAEFLGLRERAAHRATGVRLSQGLRAVAADETAASVRTWQESNRRVDALERLDERRRDEYDIEARRAEDTAVDEIVVARARSNA